MIKPILLSTSMLLFGASALAQNPTFSTGSNTYAPLTGATQVVKDTVWDDPTDWTVQNQQIDLGFTFKAFGKNITTFLWEQGAVYYRQVDTVVYIGLDDVDMCDYGFGTNNANSPILMKKEGGPGSRIVKLEWQHFGFWDDWNKNGVCKDSGNVQLWIYENPQKIEVHFGKSKLADFNTLFPDGMRVVCAKYDDEGVTSGIKLDGNPASPTVYNFSDTATRTVSGWPAASTVYNFVFGPFNGTTEIEKYGNVYYFDGAIHVDAISYNHHMADVYNSSGAKIISTEIRNNSADVSALSPGVYIARFGDTGQFLRFVKED